MTKFQITHKQAILLFLICTISSKLQMLPTLLASSAKKDLWLVLLLGAAIDIIFLFLTISINKICPNLTIHDLLRQTFGKVFSFFIVVIFFIYFITTAVLPFEAVRDVFASNLFDSIPWQLFALFLVFCVGYLAFSGLRTIGRSAELYAYIVFFCVISLILLGAFSTDFSNILPIQLPSTNIFNTYLNHSIWFGDYMIFFVLTGRIKDTNSQLKYRDIFYFVGAIIVYAVAYVSFYGLYTVTAGSQASLLSSISAFSLLSLDIGRIDWFLVLLSQIASVISCATYTYCAADCIYQITNKRNFKICVIIAVAILYLTDNFLFGNIDQGIVFYSKYTGIVSLVLQTVVPLICLISALIIKAKNKEQRRTLC